MWMTEGEYARLMAQKRGSLGSDTGKKKKNKYGAKRVWRDGLHFDSLKEADFYSRLKLDRQAGAIAGYIVHGKMVCTTGGDSSKEQAVTYEPDFVILHNDGTYQIIDTKSKGTETQVFKNKMKALKEKFPDVEIHIR